MHNNILHHYGYSPLTPSNYRSSTIQHKMSDGVTPPCRTTVTPDKENVPSYQPLSISPVLPGSGNAYVSSRLTKASQDGAECSTTNVDEFTRFMPYSAYNFMTSKPKTVSNNGVFNKSTNSEDDSAIDVGNDSHDHLRSSDMPSFTDSSLSTQGSTSPHSTGSATSPSDSAKSSPSTSGEPVTSPESKSPESKEVKKKGRTNYTNDQIQTLMKIFHENPYPDSEMMETIAHDLGVPENKIKIWFQNKRARWRRRVNNSVASFPQHFMPMPPMFSPVGPYGFMPKGHMMTSSPTQMMYPGYYNYVAMQAPANALSPNNSAGSKMQMAYPTVGQQFPFTSTYHPTPSTTLSFNSRNTSPLSSMTSSALPYSSRNNSPLSSMASSALPYSSRNTSPLSAMTSTASPYSSGNTSPLATMTSHNDRYHPQYPQFSCQS